MTTSRLAKANCPCRRYPGLIAIKVTLGLLQADPLIKSIARDRGSRSEHKPFKPESGEEAKLPPLHPSIFILM